MSLAELPVIAAVGLGVLTSISPCPMASHAAAVSVLVRQADSWKHGLLAGTAYALGRATSYALVAWIASEGLVRLGPLVRKIQLHAETGLGLAFLAGGALLAVSPWLRLPGRGIDAGAWKERLSRFGALPGAFGLGAVLALAFCPVSAGIFFGSVIPLASTASTPWLVTVPLWIGDGASGARADLGGRIWNPSDRSRFQGISRRCPVASPHFGRGHDRRRALAAGKTMALV